MPKKIFIAITAFVIVAAGIILFLFFNTREAKTIGATKTGLIGYWPMDTTDMSPTGATLYDKSGQNNHGAVIGTTTSTGILGQARTFNGGTDYIDIGSAGNLAGDITVSAWVKPMAYAGTYSAILAKSDGTVTGTQWEFTLHNNGQLELSATNGTSVFTGYKAGIVLGQWQFVVGIYNGTSKALNVYINGAVGTSATLTGTKSTFSGTAKIGRTSHATTYYPFTGSIDEARIYNRVLSAQEIANLYAATKTIFINSAPKNQLVGYWTMDTNDINGTNYYDKSGFGNNATSTGSPTITTGKIKQAVGLNSTTQFLNAGSGASLNLTDNFSLSVWVKTNSIGAIQMIINKSGGSLTDSQYELRLAADGTPNFVATNGTSAFTATHNILTANTWYHLVAVMNNKVMNLYVNGAGGTPATLTGAQSTTSLNTFIGRGGGAYLNNYFFNGAIDDVRIYNYALLAQEVSQLYNAAKITHINSANNTGLVGYWPMDATDVSGTTLYSRGGVVANNGAMTGTTNTSGIKKQARNFNGTSNVILVSKDTDQGSLDLTQQVTMSAWIYPTSTQTPMTVMEKDYNFQGYALYILDGNHLHADVFNGSGTTIAEGGTIKQNQWNFVAGTYDGTNIRAYVDGVQVGIAAGPSSIGIPNVSLRIGAWFDLVQTSRFFKGRIDEVRLYNRALSAQEIANLYNATKIIHSN